MKLEFDNKKFNLEELKIFSASYHKLLDVLTNKYPKWVLNFMPYDVYTNRNELPTELKDDISKQIECSVHAYLMEDQLISFDEKEPAFKITKDGATLIEWSKGVSWSESVITEEPEHILADLIRMASLRVNDPNEHYVMMGLLNENGLTDRGAELVTLIVTLRPKESIDLLHDLLEGYSSNAQADGNGKWNPDAYIKEIVNFVPKKLWTIILPQLDREVAEFFAAKIKA